MKVDISKIVAKPDAVYSLPHCPKGINIFVVGGGGTASWFVPFALRLTKYGKVFPNIKITVIDGDHLETKNLGRQNFHQKYLNQNKAKALSETWGSFVGYPVAYIDKFLFTADEMRKVFCPPTGELPIIMGCVDSIPCRAEINKVFKDPNSPRMLWIDAGNREKDGQVIVADNRDPRFLTIVDRNKELFSEENIQRERESEMSCAEHTEENIQNMTANVHAATYQFEILSILLGGDAIDFSCLTFDTKNMAFSKEELKY